MHEKFNLELSLRNFYEATTQLHLASAAFAKDIPKPDYPIQSAWLMNFASHLFEQYQLTHNPEIYAAYQKLATQTGQFHSETQSVFLDSKTDFRLLTQTYKALRAIGEKIEQTVYSEVQQTESLESMLTNTEQVFNSPHINPLRSLYHVTVYARLNMIFMDMIEEETLSTLTPEIANSKPAKIFYQILNTFFQHSQQQANKILAVLQSENLSLEHPARTELTNEVNTLVQELKILETEYLASVQYQLLPSPSPHSEPKPHQEKLRT